MKAYVRKFHSEAAKRKAEESAELLRLELFIECRQGTTIEC